MRIAIISTMLADPWGGSELLWAEMCKEALIAGHEVALMLYRPHEGVAPIDALRKAGMQILRTPRAGPAKKYGIESGVDCQITSPTRIATCWIGVLM